MCVCVSSTLPVVFISLLYFCLPLLPLSISLTLPYSPPPLSLSLSQADSGDISKDELQRYMELAQYSLGTDELVKGLSLEGQPFCDH